MTAARAQSWGRGSGWCCCDSVRDKALLLCPRPRLTSQGCYGQRWAFCSSCLSASTKPLGGRGVRAREPVHSVSANPGLWPSGPICCALCHLRSRVETDPPPLAGASSFVKDVHCPGKAAEASAVFTAQFKGVSAQMALPSLWLCAGDPQALPSPTWPHPHFKALSVGLGGPHLLAGSLAAQLLPPHSALTPQHSCSL